jgi:hypothetical protein
MMSDAAPEWKGMENDFMALPERMWYHRDDVKQDCYVSCVNGPFGELLLDGIAKLADEAGIDGVYMDGTTVPWACQNPTHPGCGEYQGDGTYLAHQPLRATRQFMKRLRSIFAQRRREFFLDAHTGAPSTSRPSLSATGTSTARRWHGTSPVSGWPPTPSSPATWASSSGSGGSSCPTDTRWRKPWQFP